MSACRDERQAAGRERPSQCADVPFTEWDETMEKALDAPTAGMIVNSSELRAAGL